jgi:hypothetical protein
LLGFGQQRLVLIGFGVAIEQVVIDVSGKNDALTGAVKRNDDHPNIEGRLDCQRRIFSTTTPAFIRGFATIGILEL